jgi:hypothetical protein
MTTESRANEMEVEMNSRKRNKRTALEQVSTAKLSYMVEEYEGLHLITISFYFDC